jgi:diadenosine tetraphosphate (Ap4A) HIT family hydrolase
MSLEENNTETYNNDCIFCKIANKKEQAYIIWENENFMAFLSIYPNTDGVTVVIPKKHYPSYIFDMEDNLINEIMKAVKKVSKIIDSKLENVGRTALIFEGFGVNHLHAKLFPMHGTKKLTNNWQMVKSNQNIFFTQYNGYVSSHDYNDYKKQQLIEIYKKLTNEKND